jgi:hypothetical protein
MRNLAIGYRDSAIGLSLSGYPAIGSGYWVIGIEIALSGYCPAAIG